MVRKIWIAVIAIIVLTTFTLGYFLPHRDFLFIWLVGINLVAFGVYWYDKAIAGGRSFRIPEALLHTLALLGGWPLAWVSMRLFRHKTGSNSKAFRRIFYLCMAGNILLVAWIYYKFIGF